MLKNLAVKVEFGTSLIDAVRNKRERIISGILKWGHKHLREYPWRSHGRTPYEVLVAEVLLKRTTSTAAARVYEDFLRRFPSLQDIFDANERDLAKVFSKVGLQWQKAKAIKSLAYYLSEAKSGNIPTDLEQLLIVPGIGDYSARAVLSFGFGIPTAVVDANVERILSRVFQNVLPHRCPQRWLQGIADSLVPIESHREYNFGLLDLGALVCRYINPQCEECTLHLVCDFNNLNKGRLIREQSDKHQTVIGMEIRRLRKEKGIGLAKLAQSSGLSKLTIIRIESGRTSPKPATLRKIAIALEVDTINQDRVINSHMAARNDNIK